MAIDIRPGQLPHIFWIDLDQDGTLTECAVMKQDGNKNIYYFAINSLDSIDKRRLLRIIQNRNAPSFELWDLMSNITLNNGINALEYFHQLVKVLTPSGVKMNPRSGVVGAERAGTVNTRPTQDQISQAAAQQSMTEEAQPQAEPQTEEPQAQADPQPEATQPQQAKKKTASKKTTAKK